MLLEIRGHNLPGRSWRLDDEPCDNVHVGIQVRRDPRKLFRGDSDKATWETEIDVIDRNGSTDFRGEAVQGKRGERFVYLTWGNVGDNGSFRMFRRAKLMLADLAPFVGESHIIATVDLSDGCGGPRCARLKPPALQLRPGRTPQ